jgi:hypothetical protein
MRYILHGLLMQPRTLARQLGAARCVPAVSKGPTDYEANCPLRTYDEVLVVIYSVWVLTSLETASGSSRQVKAQSYKDPWTIEG